MQSKIATPNSAPSLSHTRIDCRIPRRDVSLGRRQMPQEMRLMPSDTPRSSPTSAPMDVAQRSQPFLCAGTHGHPTPRMLRAGEPALRNTSHTHTVRTGTHVVATEREGHAGERRRRITCVKSLLVFCALILRATNTRRDWTLCDRGAALSEWSNAGRFPRDRDRQVGYWALGSSTGVRTRHYRPHRIRKVVP